MLIGCGDSRSGTEAVATPTIDPTATPSAFVTPTAAGLVAWAGGVPFVRRSQDGGLSWSVGLDRAGGEVFGIDFVDRQTGWAVGGEINGPIVLHTSDAGVTWIDQARNGLGRPGVLRAVAFADAHHGVVVGGEDFSGPPIAFLTRDAGEHWVAAPIIGSDVAPSALANVCMTPSGFGVAAGEGILIRTEDGGASWTNVARQIGAPFQGVAVACPGERDLWVVGGAGPVAVSADGGATWIERAAVPRGLLVFDAAFVDPRTGWVVAYDNEARRGVVVNTIDGGEAWEEQTIIADVGGLSGTFFSIAFADPRHGLIAGFDSPGPGIGDGPDLLTFTTDDGGATWTSGFVPPETGALAGAAAIFDVDLVR